MQYLIEIKHLNFLIYNEVLINFCIQTSSFPNINEDHTFIEANQSAFEIQTRYTYK